MRIPLLLALAAAALVGCRSIPSDAPRAQANLQPTKGHNVPDDYKTQPTGNAGARSACAVIQRS